MQLLEDAFSSGAATSIVATRSGLSWRTASLRTVESTHWGQTARLQLRALRGRLGKRVHREIGEDGPATCVALVIEGVVCCTPGTQGGLESESDDSSGQLSAGSSAG
eukprot:2988712-Amphidinium_carterae.3